MPALKYIGRKQPCRTFSEFTGLAWMPGDVNAVSEAHAERLLRHPDMFVATNEPNTKPAEPMAPGPVQTSGLPEWATKGIGLGLTDDQLEAIAQAGGPATEDGAKLWADYSGTAWTAEPAPVTQPAPTKPTAKKAAAKTAGKRTQRKA